ncbi:hypothetical protein SAMN05444487_10670 [Marininema mesophilum]|uniref:Uncharacterized protein n=1 Tax=Marininema mesophilum TaxID=1048340 RepID=A0A1H2WAV2_9BACL|nr:hypothetical protein SAMN05444487_10670 [Marininema mesophilum]
MNESILIINKIISIDPFIESSFPWRSLNDGVYVDSASPLWKVSPYIITDRDADCQRFQKIVLERG